MKVRASMIAGLALTLAGCTTTGPAKNAIEEKWNGREAGAFFAKFGPPVADTAAGGATLYTWRGGRSTRTLPAEYETARDGTRGRLLRPARTVYLRCEVQLTVSPDYVIRSVRTVVDRPGANGGPSYCEEFLTAN
ncbi:hypothetical protein FE840_009290 [Peteryoungia desertarenae]|uniref:Lipoprotein n=1 Tax=Peteryoungia desertarenae TaxID=1813451 RepID=A0ABX6QMG3_9HYPH|nr:hypothetical protein [Peteryoungia desertarenae]QLF69719.1 hypothetical protein FE840_009290 [Peteryoungia desertarenae]